MFNKRHTSVTNDASLVVLSLGGDRDAFCKIVSRYQNLLCSIAYSSLGDIKHSEDVAQETFIEAWKKLDTLKEPAKLKSWLCGILRFKISYFWRKEDKQPTKNANELEEDANLDETHQALEESVIHQQEQTLLWKTLDQIDEIYREPLILYYRESQTVERVAQELDLTLDTAKQRLSRGRKELKRAMVIFVEDSLSKSKPGAGFTAAVLFSISTIPPAAKAASLGAGAFKGSSFFKLTSILTFLAIFSGVISSFFGLKASLYQSRTKRERKLTIKIVGLFFFFVILFIIAMLLLNYLALKYSAYALPLAVSSQLIVLAFVITYLILIRSMLKKMRELRKQERIFNPQAFTLESDKIDSKEREYVSKTTLFGYPLFHFQFSKPEDGDKPAVGWIAGGNRAHGLLFAWGGIALAPISVGIVAVGVISVGAVSIGLLSAGTVAIGFIGFGASAVAYKAYASLSALGWESALSGGFSIAKEAAIGTVAYAETINNEQAAAIINYDFFTTNFDWVLGFIALVVILPAILHAKKVKKRMSS